MFIPVMVFLLLLQTVQAQKNFSELDTLMSLRKGQFGNNMGVMIWKDTIIHQRFTGDFTLNTQMPIGCASAWLTAALSMTFVDEGKISLDDPISKYLPIYATYAKKYLTIRHCLANVTGLAAEKGGIQRFFQKNKFETLEDEVNSYASSRAIVNNPGEAFNYNNMGTNIVGRVLEIVGKKSFDRLMMERIFRPCAMKKSSFTSEGAINPFSGAVSTPADYLKFLAMLMNKGMAGVKKVLSEASIAEMQKVQTGTAKIIFVPKDLEGYSYCLGHWLKPADMNITSPGLSGGWEYIDLQKKYACVIFAIPKKQDDKKKIYQEFIDAVSRQF
ncbi:MAG: serine hydrolase domain-containing protein [Flavitalea sp.]